MNWNNKNKERIYLLLWEKFDKLILSPSFSSYLNEFFSEFKIDLISRKSKKISSHWHPYSGPWLDAEGKPARSKHHVVIVSPWFVEEGTDGCATFSSPLGPTQVLNGEARLLFAKEFFRRSIIHKNGLRIPKDIAEKFLVFGVP